MLGARFVKPEQKTKNLKQLLKIMFTKCRSSYLIKLDNLKINEFWLIRLPVDYVRNHNLERPSCRDPDSWKSSSWLVSITYICSFPSFYWRSHFLLLFFVLAGTSCKLPHSLICIYGKLLKFRSYLLICRVENEFFYLFSIHCSSDTEHLAFYANIVRV